MAKKITQVDKVMEYLNKYPSISDAECLEHLGIKRLSAVINQMRDNHGWVIPRGENIAPKGAVPNANYTPTYNPTGDNAREARINSILDEHYTDKFDDSVAELLVDILHWCKINGINDIEIGHKATALYKNKN